MFVRCAACVEEGGVRGGRVGEKLKGGRETYPQHP